MSVLFKGFPSFLSGPLHRLHWTTNFKTFFVSVMNMLLIYLFASMKLEIFEITLHYDILRNRLKYYTERLFK